MKWVREEVNVAMERAVRDRSFRAFVVLLPATPAVFEPADLPPFIGQRTWVDLRRISDPEEAADELARAVRGEPGPGPAREGLLRLQGR
jgi:hypothetical protein